MVVRCVSPQSQLSKCALSLTRRAYRARRGAQAQTKRDWELGDGKYDAYAKQRGEVCAPIVPGCQLGPLWLTRCAATGHRGDGRQRSR